MVFDNFQWNSIIIAYIIYLLIIQTKPKKKKRYIPIHRTNIQLFGSVILFLHFFFILFWGVGKAEADVYEAPFFIKPLIQIVLRFPYQFWGAILILISKTKKTSFFYGVIVLIISIMQGFFGILILIGSIFYLKYYKEANKFISNYKLIFISILIFLPTVIQVTYNFRNQLRDNNVEETYNVIDLIAGKVIGRLSSFSDSAYLIENAPLFIGSTSVFDNFFFQRNMLRVISGSFGTEETPESILYGGPKENVSFMLGTQGILIYSLYKSIFSFIINLISIVIIDFIIFKLMNRIRINYINELTFILLLGPTISGVAVEYFSLLINILLFIIVNLVANLFISVKK